MDGLSTPRMTGQCIAAALVVVAGCRSASVPARPTAPTTPPVSEAAVLKALQEAEAVELPPEPHAPTAEAITLFSDSALLGGAVAVVRVKVSDEHSEDLLDRDYAFLMDVSEPTPSLVKELETAEGTTEVSFEPRGKHVDLVLASSGWADGGCQYGWRNVFIYPLGGSVRDLKLGFKLQTAESIRRASVDEDDDEGDGLSADETVEIGLMFPDLDGDGHHDIRAAGTQVGGGPDREGWATWRYDPATRSYVDVDYEDLPQAQGCF